MSPHHKQKEVILKWKNMEWIEVSDRLPEDSLDVLVVNKINDKKSVIAFDYAVDGYFYRHFNVTHWMPLPELPCKN